MLFLCFITGQVTGPQFLKISKNQRMESPLAQKLVSTYQELFKSKPLVVRSPGRVNIIGEHTDYNEGFVLPAAIDKAVFVAAHKRADDQIILYSIDFKDKFEGRVAEIKRCDKHWANYILGVAAQLIRRGYQIGGFNLIIDGDVPLGAGLSSSAAVECATAYALNELFGLGISKKELTNIAQKAEHEFAGVMCGIMDQFASVFGKKDHVIKLDCRSLDYEYVPLKLEGYKILLLNTNVKHSLASSEYNARRQQCEEGVALVQKHHPGVESLRDVSLEMLEQHVKGYEDIYNRCKYVVEENIRLLEGCEDLKRGDINALGKKMFQTHDGLSKEYEVSCPELDFLVNTVRSNPNVLGARMMGGGFGGCTINLVKEAVIDEIVEALSKSYNEQMGKELTPYLAQTEEGTSVVHI
jgi:galactokinase